MLGRRRAREIVMQLLYRDDVNEVALPALDEQFLTGRLFGDRRLIAFARTLLEGVRERSDHLDRMLGGAADNWSLHRMAVTDRNILRIAAWEIRYGDTPHRVAVNEAIELAKRFGDANSARFVNGILDRLMRTPHQRTTLDTLVESASSRERDEDDA